MVKDQVGSSGAEDPVQITVEAALHSNPEVDEGGNPPKRLRSSERESKARDEFAAKCARYCTGGLLDRRAGHFYYCAIATASGDSVLFTSMPYIAFMSKRKGLLFLCLFLLICLYILVSSTRTALGDHIIEAQKFRFTALKLRDGTLAPQQLELSAIRLTRNGCDLKTEHLGLEQQGAKIFFTYPHPITCNGWAFETNPSNPYTDPVVFELEAQKDGSQEWSRIASSTWYGEKPLSPRHYSTPKSRNQRVEFSFCPSWQWALRMVGTYGVFTLYALVTAIFSSLRISQGHLTVVLNCMIITCILINLIAQIGAQRGDQEAAICSFLALSAFGAPYFWGEYLFWLSLFAGGIFNFAAGLYLTVMHQLLYTQLPVGAFLVMIVVFSWYFRKRKTQTAFNLILPDKEKYDECWAALISQEDTVQELKSLQESLMKLMIFSGGVTTQTHRASEEEFDMFSSQNETDEKLHSRLPSTIANFAMKKAEARSLRPWGFNRSFGNSFGRPNVMTMNSFDGLVSVLPNKSLSKLFVQAEFMHPRLIQKVQSWAQQSGGFFRAGPGKHGDHYLNWGEASEAERLGVKWAHVKTPSRAIEKIMRSYYGDPSKLLDLCRQGIYFDTIHDVNRCVKAIEADKEVHIERVKNRFHMDYDSFSSAGYRDVSISLRITTEETAAVGADLFICELQLLLKQIADLKNDEGHKRYVDFRNFRAE